MSALQLFRPRGRNISFATAALLMMPFFVLMAICFLWPIGALLWTSAFDPAPNLENYKRIADSPLYTVVLFRTIRTAFIVSVVALLLAFPVASAMSRASGWKAVVIAACVFLPFWSSVLVRTSAWSIILQRNGIVNSALLSLGVIGSPIQLLYNQFAVVIAMVHVLMPFMVLPLYGTLRSIPPDYRRAAAIHGASPVRVFFNVTLPLAMPGIVSGFILVFLTALGYFITPSLLGSPQEMMISTLISQQLREVLDWPFAAALVGAMLAVVLIIAFAFGRVVKFERLMGGGA